MYWTLKRNHFDSILLFKKGKAFEAYYEDALELKRHCALPFYGDKMMVSFAERFLYTNIAILVDKDLKVAVAENVNDNLSGKKKH